MDEDIEEIITALEAGDWEKATTLINEIDGSKLDLLEDEYVQFIKMRVKRLIETRK